MANRPRLETYLKLCTEYYDLEKHPHDAKAQDFYLDYALKANGPILEPMCGTGRFLIPMLQAGLNVEGFDASVHMLNALAQKYPNIRPHTVWQQFVEDFKGDKLYQLIFVPYGSWGLITDLESSSLGLKNMYNHLVPGGKLVLEIETVASVPADCGIWHRGINTRADGSYIALNTLPSYNTITQIFRSICRYESIRKNTIELVETEDFQMYLYTFDEFDKFLKDAGFTNITKYQDHSKTPATDSNAPIIIYECTK